MLPITTTGTCRFCNQSFSQTEMTQHLQACPARQAAIERLNAEGKPQGRRRIFHLHIKGLYAPQYWLHVEMISTAYLATLDAFLRTTWLECCGHLSMFKIGDIDYERYTEPGFTIPGNEANRDMDVLVGRVLREGLEFTHEYDYGSTTELALKVGGVRTGHMPDRLYEIHVMARNDPPALTCQVCGENPAMLINPFDMDEMLWCEACAGRHFEPGFIALPLVNSPRAGVCGYTGDREEGQRFGEAMERIESAILEREDSEGTIPDENDEEQP